MQLEKQKELLKASLTEDLEKTEKAYEEINRQIAKGTKYIEPSATRSPYDIRPPEKGREVPFSDEEIGSNYRERGLELAKMKDLRMKIFEISGDQSILDEDQLKTLNAIAAASGTIVDNGNKSKETDAERNKRLREAEKRLERINKALEDTVRLSEKTEREWAKIAESMEIPSGRSLIEKEDTWDNMIKVAGAYDDTLEKIQKKSGPASDGEITKMAEEYNFYAEQIKLLGKESEKGGEAVKSLNALMMELANNRPDAVLTGEDGNIIGIDTEKILGEKETLTTVQRINLIAQSMQGLAQASQDMITTLNDSNASFLQKASSVIGVIGQMVSMYAALAMAKTAASESTKGVVGIGAAIVAGAALLAMIGSIKNASKKATGGFSQEGNFFAGEGGVEFVDTKTPTRVYSAAQTKRMFGDYSSGQVVFSWSVR
jgi:hypothetical protein